MVVCSDAVTPTSSPVNPSSLRQANADDEPRNENAGTTVGELTHARPTESMPHRMRRCTLSAMSLSKRSSDCRGDTVPSNVDDARMAVGSE